MRGTRPLPPIVVRAIAGLSLLLLLCLPAGFLAAIWTLEERWLRTGMVLAGVGPGVAWLLATEPEIPVPPDPSRFQPPTRAEIGEQQ